MNFAIEESKDKVTLVLAGDLTITQISVAREELQNALNKSQHIELDLEEVKKVDLTFLQLLCSAHRKAVAMGKNLVFTGNIPAIFKKSIEDNCHEQRQDCKLDANENCLWIIK